MRFYDYQLVLVCARWGRILKIVTRYLPGLIGVLVAAIALLHCCCSRTHSLTYVYLLTHLLTESLFFEDRRVQIANSLVMSANIVDDGYFPTFPPERNHYEVIMLIECVSERVVEEHIHSTALLTHSLIHPLPCRDCGRWPTPMETDPSAVPQRWSFSKRVK
jgi:hypothetical protein